MENIAYVWSRFIPLASVNEPNKETNKMGDEKKNPGNSKKTEQFRTQIFGKQKYNQILKKENIMKNFFIL